MLYLSGRWPASMAPGVIVHYETASVTTLPTMPHHKCVVTSPTHRRTRGRQQRLPPRNPTDDYATNMTFELPIPFVTADPPIATSDKTYTSIQTAQFPNGDVRTFASEGALPAGTLMSFTDDHAADGSLVVGEVAVNYLVPNSF